jgi:NAD(P)H-hydrate epimerase
MLVAMSVPRLKDVTTVRFPPAAPARPADGHKGTFGTVIVIGGGPTMIGAPALSAAGALRAGAGLVKIAAPAGILPYCLVLEACATGIALGDQDLAATPQLIDQADPEHRAVLAVGPGLGRSDTAEQLVDGLLAGRRGMVLDADGLNLLARAGHTRPLPGPALVMTPHPGEFARLAAPLGITESPTDLQTRPAAGLKLALAHQNVVVLKGRQTVVCDGRGEPKLYLNKTGNPALATAGSGDVLTGVIAALMAQGLDRFDAAVLGVHLHGLAGDLWAERYGPSGLTARDLAGLIPEAMQRHRARGAEG